MLIDWFTVGAQALNFVLLIWLMKRFLYQPILQAIESREKLIAAELADAAAQKAEAHRDRDEFQRKNQEFDGERAALLSKATGEAKAERDRLTEEARKAAEASIAIQQQKLANDARHLNQAICLRTQQEVFAIARKTLADLATANLEECITQVFTRRVREMEPSAKERLATALETASEPAVLRSAFELPAGQQAAIQNALNETFSTEVRLRYEIATDQISGIEFTTNGQKMAWSIADYLESMENRLSELMNMQTKSEPGREGNATPASVLKS